MSQGPATSHLSRLASAVEWAAMARRLMTEGHNFEAYDLCGEGLTAHPGDLTLSLLSALLLLRCGAEREALRLVESHNWFPPSREILERRAIQALTAGLRSVAAGATDDDPLRTALHAVSDLVGAYDPRRPQRPGDIADPLLLAELCSEIALRTDDPLYHERARIIHLELFLAGGDCRHGAQAALLAWKLGRRDEAIDLAGAVLNAAPSPSDSIEHILARGQACLLVGRAEDAGAACQKAATAPGWTYRQRVVGRRALLDLAAHGVAVPSDVLDLLRPPTVAIFAGQALDGPLTDDPIFPEAIESAVAAQIAAAVDRIGIEIGYSSASAGSDLLFIEALLERDAEINIHLPFAVEDFVALRVAPAGRRWERRFRKALKLANSVSLVTEDRHLGHDALFTHANRVIDGLARLQARSLGAAPHLVAVFDYAAPAVPGSPTEFIDNWADPARLCFIDLDDIRTTAGPLPASPARPVAIAEEAPPSAASRHVKTMMFSDVVGFSRLQDEHLPILWRVFEQIAAAMGAALDLPSAIESWGDGLFVVMDTAMDLADYVFALLDAIAGIDALAAGLPVPISLRIGLHTGPIFSGRHPLTGKPMVFGGHVNRAARIEPISIPGNVYASQQFVAQLVSEESVLEAEARLGGGRYDQRYVCEYVGTLELAKKFGRQAVYSLRRAAPRRDSAQDPSGSR